MTTLQSDQINDLIQALSKAQGEITPALKDNLNPHYKSKYADLSSVWAACREPLSKNGLAVTQSTMPSETGLMLVTTLAHSSGQWIRSYMPVITQKSDAQGLGSALTYSRRYSLSAIVGVAPDEDDDGEAAVARGNKRETVQTITAEQASQLCDLLKDCSQEYQADIRNFCKNMGVPDSLRGLPISYYDRMLAAINKKRTENMEVEHAAAN